MLLCISWYTCACNSTTSLVACLRCNHVGVAGFECGLLLLSAQPFRSYRFDARDLESKEMWHIWIGELVQGGWR
jgi:hypothetical protein